MPHRVPPLDVGTFFIYSQFKVFTVFANNNQTCKQEEIMNFILLGAPGAGKGTLSQRLVAAFGLVQISTGDILRKEIADGSELGRRASSFIEKGELVPDEVILGIVENRIMEKDCAKGFIMDGFPRTIVQAENFDTMLAKNKLQIDAIIELAISDDEVIRRLTSRRTCSNTSCQAIYNILTSPPENAGICDRCGSALIQRSDESEQTVRNRLVTYYDKTSPLVKYYSSSARYLKIDAKGSIDDIFSDVVNKTGLK